MSLNSVYGTVCAPNERPQLNAAQTHLFCICHNQDCDTEYTDTVLNALLLCLIILLLGSLALTIVRLRASVAPREHSEAPVRRWTQMTVRGGSSI